MKKNEGFKKIAKGLLNIVTKPPVGGNYDGIGTFCIECKTIHKGPCPKGISTGVDLIKHGIEDLKNPSEK